MPPFVGILVSVGLGLPPFVGLSISVGFGLPPLVGTFKFVWVDDDGEVTEVERGIEVV